MKIFFGFASTLSRSSFPVFVAWFVAVVLMCGFVVADRSAFAQEGDAVVPVVGSFGMGGSATGGVNEATGVFGVQVPVMGVPGVNDGGADLSVSYRQNSSETEEQGVGARWVWGVSRVVVDGGVKVFPASGGVFDADASTPTGLVGYPLEDVRFTQTPGVLPVRTGISGPVEYAYALEYAGGKDYFTTTGHLAARTGLYDTRTDWRWEDNRLASVTNDAGITVTLTYTDTGVEVTTPPRSDGMTVITTLEIQNNRLTTITDPVGQKVSLTYTDTGLLEGISTTGATTHITYQTLPDGAVAVDTVRVIDAVTGKELSTRTWNVIGEHTATGWPTYQGHAVLWASGDDLGFMWWLQHSDI